MKCCIESLISFKILANVMGEAVACILLCRVSDTMFAECQSQRMKRGGSFMFCKKKKKKKPVQTSANHNNFV